MSRHPPAHQQINADRIKDIAVAICKENDLERICGNDTWRIVCREYGYDYLCARIGNGDNHEGDCLHAGGWGGAQHLNACV